MSSLLGIEPLTFLITYIYNPIAISEALGDPRTTILTEVASELQRRGHKVLMLPVEHDSAVRIMMSARRAQQRKRAHTSQRLLADFGEPVCKQGAKVRRRLAVPCAIPPDVRPHYAIFWSNYNGARAIGAAPSVVYENGFTRGTVVVDPRGLLGDSFYVGSLNRLVSREYDDTQCRAHIREHLLRDSSKREQHAVVDLPPHLLGRYVLVPTQKFNDISVYQYGNVSYPELLNRTLLHCIQRDLSLVVKIHPHLAGAERRQQQ